MTTSEPAWHGWGFNDLILSVAPSPEDGRAISLILSEDDNHMVMADFVSVAHAEEVMAFLDGAFRSTAQANEMLSEEVSRHRPQDQAK